MLFFLLVSCLLFLVLAFGSNYTLAPQHRLIGNVTMVMSWMKDSARRFLVLLARIWMDRFAQVRNMLPCFVSSLPLLSSWSCCFICLHCDCFFFIAFVVHLLLSLSNEGSNWVLLLWHDDEEEVEEVEVVSCEGDCSLFPLPCCMIAFACFRHEVLLFLYPDSETLPLCLLCFVIVSLLDVFVCLFSLHGSLPQLLQCFFLFPMRRRLYIEARCLRVVLSEWHFCSGSNCIGSDWIVAAFWIAVVLSFHLIFLFPYLVACSCLSLCPLRFWGTALVCTCTLHNLLLCLYPLLLFSLLSVCLFACLACMAHCVSCSGASSCSQCGEN